MNQLTTEFIDLLKHLIRIPSVVGAEHSFFRALHRELEERGASVSFYDGLIVAQGNDPMSTLISAHIDRHGLVCTGPNEFQYAAFVAGRRSDLLGNSVSEKLILKIVDRFESAKVFAYAPWSGTYLGCGQIVRSYPCEKRKNLIFEVKGLEHVSPGTPVAFLDRLAMSETHLSGQLDNIVTVAHLVHLFEHGFQGTAFFTSHEESGSSWRYLMEWFRRMDVSTDRLIVVDTSPFPESMALPDVVLRLKDVNAPFNESFSREIEELCLSKGASYVFKDRFIEDLNRRAQERGEENQSIGSTELGRIINASGKTVTGTTLQIPTTGYHTTHETCLVRSNEVFFDLLLNLAKIR